MPFLSAEIIRDVIANLPAPGKGGRIFFASDTGQTFRDSGITWEDVTNTNASNLASGTLPAARLPNPSASTLGGVESIASVSHQFLTSISTSGVPAQAQPTEADLSLSDITTNNVSITKHGLAPKAPNDATKFLDGTGAYSTPAGTASGTVTSVALTVPTFLSVSGSPVTASGTLAVSLSGTALPVANGGTGTSSPGIVAGTNVSVTGTWPNQTVNATAVGITLKTNGTNNGSQSILNLAAGTNVTLTDNGSGQVTIDSVTGSGGTDDVPQFSTTKLVATGTNVNYGPVFPLTAPPLVSAFTWVNQGSATATDANGGLLMKAPASSGTNFRCLVKTMPTPPYTLTIYYLLDAQSINFLNSGICARDSGTGKLVVYGFSFNTNNVISANNYNSATSFNGAVGNSQWSAAGLWHPVFIRLVDDGTNFTFGYSLHGLDFGSYAPIVVSRTAFLASPNQIGFCLNSENSKAMSALLLHWKVS